MREKGSQRKVRSDKKRDVKPTIAIDLKDNIYRLSNLCKTPVKDIAEKFCCEGVDSGRVLNHLSLYFKRDVRLKNTVYLGHLGNPSPGRVSALNGRITIKFKGVNYENVCLLAYTMDATPSRAVAVLLNASIRDPIIVNAFLNSKLRMDRLSDAKKVELKKFMNFVRTNNPYEEHVTWGDIVKHAAGEVGDFVVNGWRKE